jgi:hypothetical protein
MGRENAKGIAPGAERRRVHVGDCAGRGAAGEFAWGGIAPGAERRRVHVGDCAGRGAPARSCRRLRRARSAGAFPLGEDLNFVKRPRCAFGAPPGFLWPLGSPERVRSQGP